MDIGTSVLSLHYRMRNVEKIPNSHIFLEVKESRIYLVLSDTVI